MPLATTWRDATNGKEIWLPRAPLSDAGVVSALAHTARGGDGANARMLARRLADALDAMVRQQMSASDLALEEPVP